jgi:hypothetical protein
MDVTLRIFVIVLSLLFFFAVMRMLVKQKMNESQSILWLVVALLSVIIGIFPDLIDLLAYFLHADYPPAVLFLVAILLLLIVSFKSSIDIYKSETRLIELTVTLSILKEEHKKLTALVEDLKEKSGKDEVG